MADMKAIHDFAEKWGEKFRNPKTNFIELVDHFIADDCDALGFEMDCGHAFEERYGKAVNDNETLEKVIDEITDIPLLGSAIYSQWRYFNHWAYSGEEILEPKNRAWFILALSRMATLSGETPSVFQGTLQKIHLVSNCVGYGPCPEPDDEVEQHLTITADGKVWLSRYRFGTVGCEKERIEKVNYSIPKESANEIMAAVSLFFGGEYNTELLTDVGSWDLELTNSEGRAFKIAGSLIDDEQAPLGELSELIRSRLGRNDLFIFDGNPDIVTRIEVKYHRITRIKPGVIPEGVTWEYVTWDYNETIIIDRQTETLEHIREIGTGCKVTNTYYVQEGIESFLDDVDVNAFSEIVGNPPDAVEDPMETKEYTIAIFTKHGGKRIVTGSFDKNGLPTDWPSFIDNTFEFIRFYGLGELFDSRIYGNAKRKQSDYIFCNVVFEDGGRTYCYLADSDAYCEGDLVVVPAGSDNHEAVVRIESIEYHSTEEAPFPIEKTKRIIRKYLDADSKTPIVLEEQPMDDTTK